MQKTSILGLFLLITSAQWSFAQQQSVNSSAANRSAAEQVLVNLSKEKWQWMADKNADMIDSSIGPGCWQFSKQKNFIGKYWLAELLSPI